MTGTVVVTGASGFAGSHLVERLTQEGAEVVAWGRAAAPVHTLRGVRWHQVDLASREQVERAVRDLAPAAIFHCAGRTHVGDSWSDTAAPLAVNVMGTHYILDALRRAGRGGRVLVTGSGMVYAPAQRPVTESDPLAPASPYAVSKLAQEQLGLRALREDGVDVIVTRSFNHTGPRQSPAFVAPSIARQIALIEAAGREPIIRVGNLETTRDLSDVRDVVRAYVALMRQGTPGVVYNVASGVGRTIRSLVESLIARARVPVRLETDPSLVRAVDPSAVIGDATRLRHATGWQPDIRFDRMLDDLVEYWRAQVMQQA